MIKAMLNLFNLNYILRLVLFCCYLFTAISQSVNADTDLSDPLIWNTIFSTRNDEEWRDVWHTEKHRRCYQDLLLHMEWVCEKDIYKLRKKRQIIEVNPMDGPFLSKQIAHMFGVLRLKKVNRRRQSKRGIIDECCHGITGCSWEEYAEYCPANRRLRT